MSRLSDLYRERAALARQLAAVDDALAHEHAANDTDDVHVTPEDKTAARRTVDRLLLPRKR